MSFNIDIKSMNDDIELMFELLKNINNSNRLYILNIIKKITKKIPINNVKNKKSHFNKSLIFSTLGGNYSEDIYDVDSGVLFYNGQNSAKRDHYISIGTEVWYRESKKHMYFKNIGAVKNIICLRNHSPKTNTTPAVPSLYALKIKKSTNPVTINKEEDDKFTHQAVIRYSGFPEELSAFPQGIYAI
jgi:hypothetical protein